MEVGEHGDYTSVRTKDATSLDRGRERATGKDGGGWDGDALSRCEARAVVATEIPLASSKLSAKESRAVDQWGESCEFRAGVERANPENGS